MAVRTEQNLLLRTLIGAVIVLALLGMGIAVAWQHGLRPSWLRPQPQATPAPGAPSPATVTQTRPLMSTFVTITVTAASQDEARRDVDAAFDLMASYAKSLNAHSDDSDVARINASAGKDAVAVHDEVFYAVKAGVEWHARTRGAFDITVMPLLDLWRACAKEDRLPTDSELAAARALLGADKIELNEAARTVRLPREGMRIDLGGLGKGYCADAALGLLRERGVSSALISVCGDIYALGSRAGGRPWRVGVQDPRRPDDPAALVATLALSDRAVSTSGNYARYVTIQGKRYSHIVDPRTGLPADGMPSVTVIGPNTLSTDILDTALSVLGGSAGMDLIAPMPGVEAMFVTFDINGNPLLSRSPGFARYEATRAAQETQRK